MRINIMLKNSISAKLLKALSHLLTECIGMFKGNHLWTVLRDNEIKYPGKIIY